MYDKWCTQTQPNQAPMMCETVFVGVVWYWYGPQTVRPSKIRNVHSSRRSLCVVSLEHLECSHQPHIQGRGAKKHTQRAG